MNHPEYTALMQKIIANPADDLPRLVMADWLDDHGESMRANFIRVQCEIPNCTDKPRYTQLIRLQSSYTLLIHGWYPTPSNFYVLVGGIQDPLQSIYADVLIAKRGFYAEAHISMYTWNYHGQSLVRTYPIQKVYIQDRVYLERISYINRYELPDCLIRKARNSWITQNTLL